MGWLKNIGKSIFNIKDKKQIVMPLDEELVQKNKIDEGLIKKASSLEAELARMYAEQNKVAEQNKISDAENEIAKKLKEQKAEMDNFRYGNNLSFKKFFSIYFNNKNLRNNLSVRSKDMKKDFGLFDDFRIYKDGIFGITVRGDKKGESRIISMGSTINSVLYEPSSIAEQLRRGIILIPYDEEHNFIPNIENEKIPEIYFDDKLSKYRESEEVQVSFREAVIQREEIIRELREKLELAESTFYQTKRENDTLKRSNEILNQQVHVYTAEASQAMQLSLQYGNAIGDLNRSHATLLQMSALNDEMMKRLQNVVTQLQQKSEEIQVTTHFQRAINEVKNLMEWAKNQVPETIINEIKQEPEKKPMVQINEPLK
jgi:hypothetical protein